MAEYEQRYRFEFQGRLPQKSPEVLRVKDGKIRLVQAWSALIGNEGVGLVYVSYPQPVEELDRMVVCSAFLGLPNLILEDTVHEKVEGRQGLSGNEEFIELGRSLTRIGEPELCHEMRALRKDRESAASILEVAPLSGHEPLVYECKSCPWPNNTTPAWEYGEMTGKVQGTILQTASDYLERRFRRKPMPVYWRFSADDIDDMFKNQGKAFEWIPRQPK